MTADLFAPLDALRPSPRASSNQVVSIMADAGPVDRRITTNRRLSLTALLPAAVDMVSVRRTVCGIVLSSDVAAGVIVSVRSLGTRREVWLRGREVRMLLPQALLPRRDRHGRLRSVAVEVFRRELPDYGVELEIVPRGGQRAL